MNSKIVTVVFLIFASVAISEALKCYTCGDPIMSGCKGPNVDSKYLKDCPASTQCSTISTTVGAATAVVRACGVSTVNSGCSEVPAVGKVCASVCSTDGCNTGNGVGNIRISVLGLAVTTILGWLLSSF